MGKWKEVRSILYLHALLLFYSIGTVCSKMAGKSQFMSVKFIVLYGLVIFDLFIYAIFWQQILKKMPLVTAYANKAVTVIWGIIWGRVIFKEHITVSNIIGAAIIIVGIYMVVREDAG
jgi:drug/metabolite transporter (DMT)-like permease